MRDDKRGTRCVFGEEFADHLNFGDWVDGGSRFIEHNELALPEKSTRNGETQPFTTRHIAPAEFVSQPSIEVLCESGSRSVERVSHEGVVLPAIQVGKADIIPDRQQELREVLKDSTRCGFFGSRSTL